MTNATLETVYEGAKETAKKIRAALKANFPGVKFSVRSETYSGGSSVNVSWTDLPLTEEVEKVVNRFKSGSFDGMTDMYETSGYVMDGKRYVGAKYIFCKRELSDERETMIKEWMQSNYAEINENHYSYYYHFNKAEVAMMEEEKTAAEQPEVVEVVKTVESNKNELIETKENKEVVSLTVEQDDEKGHIRLFFSTKPSQNVREILKDSGFRWYKTYWGAKQNKARFTIVEAIQTILNDTNTEESENESAEVAEEMNTQEVHITADIETPEEDSLIGRKVYANWGAMHGGQNGVITGETMGSFGDEVIVKWEDGHIENCFKKNLMGENDHGVGVYLLPVEDTSITVEPITHQEDTEQQPQKVYVTVYFENGNKDCFLISSDNVVTHEDTVDEITFRYPNSVITAYQIGNGEKMEITEEQQEEVFAAEYNTDGKVKVKRIEFIWSESAHIQDKTVISSYEEAEKLIKEAAQHAPDNGAYDKTKFCITWYDGETYTGRIDIVNSDMFKISPLKEHILDHCTFYAGTRKPSHLTQEQYESYISDVNKQDYISFMNTYSLEDEVKQPESTKEHITTQEDTNGKVLDFTSRFQQKQEKQEQAEAMDFFTSQVLPYLSFEDKMKLYTAQEDAETFNSMMFDLMVKAKKERLKTK